MKLISCNFKKNSWKKKQQKTFFSTLTVIGSLQKYFTNNNEWNKGKTTFYSFHPCWSKQACKQCRSWWDSSFWSVSSGFTLFAIPFCIFGRFPYLRYWTSPNSKMEESILETQGWKGQLLRAKSAFFFSLTNYCLERRLYVKLKDWMSNSVDPDAMAIELSHFDLCCLQKPIIIACGSERVKWENTNIINILCQTLIHWLCPHKQSVVFIGRFW